MDTPRPRKVARPDVSEDYPLTTEHVQEISRYSRLVDEIKETADKLVRDQATIGDIKILSRALRELRYAFKVFTPYRRQRKITVFGSARLKPEHPAYQTAVELGRQFAEHGWYVVTGAGGGIMEAAHVGAGRNMSMGLNIILPFEQEANYIISNDQKLVNLRYFFTRKLMFVKEVHAVALFPGGFGTQDELFETLTLIQTGKRDLMPVVCIDGPEGTYWHGWLDFIREHLDKHGLISHEDLSLFKITNDVDEAVDEVIGFYCVYNSMRYIREKLFIRLHVAPPPELIERLNDEFQDIIVKGKIASVPCHEFESDEDHLAELPRLAFHFNRRNFGRLRQMIDLINDQLCDHCDLNYPGSCE